MAKTRAAEDGASPKPTAAGCEKILFGWQAIDANARQVVITEGEIDVGLKRQERADQQQQQAQLSEGVQTAEALGKAAPALEAVTGALAAE